jgi:ribose transport system substrate-binding protein
MDNNKINEYIKAHKIIQMRKILLFLLTILCIQACNNSTDNPETAQSDANAENIKIAVIPKGTTHIYWNSVHAGAAKAAKELGVTIFWQGPLKEDDRQVQIQTVQNFISRGVDAIALAPLDSRSLIPSVKSARNRKIPVIIFDSDLGSEEYESFVATDNIEGGRMSAKRLSEVMGGKGKVILLRYSEGSASTTNREEGFLQGIREYGKDMELISSNQYAGVTIEKALQVAQNLLNRYPDVGGVFCPNETSAQAMLRALQMSNKTGKVKLIGFDANETLVNALKKGEIQGLALQDPFNMGYMAVATATQVIRGEKVEKRIDTGIQMVTLENMNEEDIKVLLYPEIDKWLP